VQDELRIEATADPNGENKTGQQGCGGSGVAQCVVAEKECKRKDERNYGNFSQKSTEQNTQPADSRGDTHAKTPSLATVGAQL